MKKVLLLCCLFVCFAILHAMAQGGTVTGKVTAAEDGSPIPGVNVVIRGTNTGTITDVEGNYQLAVPSPGTDVLVFSYVGYNAQEIPVNNRTTLNVQLAQNVERLKEVVVTALGLEEDRDRFGSTSSNVKGESVARSGEPTVIQGLAGKTPGVNIVRSGGDPGSGAFIQIRGASTITGNTQPLIVVDGVPISNASYGQGATGVTGGQGVDGVVQQSRLNDINPNDIASMEILRGASAAALWGSRAANGVIVITTKRGRASGDKVNISFGNSVSFDRINRTVPLQRAFGQGNNGRFIFGDRRSWGDRIADRSGGEDVQVTTGDFAELPDGTRRYRIPSGTPENPHGGKNSRETFDHGREVFRTGYFIDNNLSLSGGDEKSTYFLSLSNLNQQGIIKNNSDYVRRTFRFNGDRKFGQWLKLSANANYSRVSSNRAQQGSNLSGIFLGGLRTAPDFNNEQAYTGTYVNASGVRFPGRQISYRNPIGANINPGYDNPFWVINNIINRSTVDRIFGNVEATVNATKWLSFIARSGIDNFSDNRYENFPLYSAAFQQGQLTIQHIRESQFNTDLISRAYYNISESFTGSVLVGFNFNNRYTESVGASVRNFILPGAPFDLSNSASTSRFPFNNRFTIRTAAAYAQADIGLFNQLFLTLTGRSESASTFGPLANATFFYPSASLAWQFTELGGLRNNNFLSFGKLRASYGSVGVQPPPYLTTTDYVPADANTVVESWGPALDASSPVYGGGYLRGPIQGNPYLRPERKNEFEIGTDLRFFRDRTRFSATYYQNRTLDAIFAVQIAASTGFTNRYDNAASLENRGLELELNTTVLQAGGFTWTAHANWSRNRNRVIELRGTESLFLNGFTGGSSRAVEGYPLGALWGGKFERNEGGQLVLDANGFPQQAIAEGVIGDPTPNWLGGLGNTFAFKGLSLYFLFDHVNGGDVWNGTRGALYTFGTHADVGVESVASQDLRTYYGTVIPAGTTFRGKVHDFGGGPVALNQDWYTSLGGGFGPVAEQFVEDGTRTRLREATLSYSLASEAFRRATKLQGIDFAVTGRNLLLFTNYVGVDPETNLTGPSNGRGLDYFNNPSTRSVLFTIRINY